MSTEAPLGSPSSLIGPVYVDSAARPMLDIARYITAPPAAVPMSARRSRLRMFVASRSDIIWPPRFCARRESFSPRPSIDTVGNGAPDTFDGRKLHAPHKRRPENLTGAHPAGNSKSENERLPSRVG